jgi:hypothetical protein
LVFPVVSSFWLSHQYPICISLLPHSCHMSCPSHPPWLEMNYIFINLCRTPCHDVSKKIFEGIIDWLLDCSQSMAVEWLAPIICIWDVLGSKINCLGLGFAYFLHSLMTDSGKAF